MLSYTFTLFAANVCQEGTFFGLIPWWQYLPAGKLDPKTCDIKDFVLFESGKTSDIPFVLLAVIDDLLRIAAIVAIGFVIVGGFQLIASQGSPDAASKARNTIINALLGMAIAVISVSFVGYLGRRLGG